MKKKIMHKIRIATAKLEEEEINIIDAIEMLEAMKKLSERISEDEMNSFVDSASVCQNERSQSRGTYRQKSSSETWTISF